MSLVHTSTPASQSLLSSKTTANILPFRSLKVRFKLPVMKKASPTVSVTNTIAARVNAVSPSILLQDSSQSSVSFPSSPIPCLSRKRATSEEVYDLHGEEERFEATDYFPKQVQGTKAKGSVLPVNRRISNIDIIRRRSKSCLATSYFHSDADLARKSRSGSDSPASTPSEQPVRKRLGIRRESMSAGNPSGKGIRQAKRALADAQFLASIHRSIALHVQARRHSGGSPTSSQDECASQDVLLVERIWHTLIGMGYKPVPMDDATSHPSSSGIVAPPQCDPVRQAAERAARRTVAASSTFTTDNVQPLPSTPTVPLAVPQLVATLIMRHRDRSTTRPRSASKVHATSAIRNREEPLLRSPLSFVVLPPRTPVPITTAASVGR